MKKAVVLKIVWIAGLILFAYSVFLYVSGVFGRHEYGKIIGGFFLMIVSLIITFSGYKAWSRNKLTIISQEMQKKFLKSISFNEDIEIPVNYYRNFILDYDNHRIFVTPIFTKVKNAAFNDSCIFDLNNMTDVALRKNHKTISKTEGGMGGALIGGALFGIAGAIIGSNATKKTAATKEITSLNINILTREREVPIWKIKFIENPKADLSEYHKLAKNAERIYSVLRNWLITADERKRKVKLKKTHKESEQKQADDKEKSDNEIIAVDIARELREYKKLLDDGIITREEFGAIKKERLIYKYIY